MLNASDGHLSNLERAPTGINGLDDLLEQGLPRKRCTLLCGVPGSGKTILSVQFLINGIEKFGEPGVFVTLAEDPLHIKEEMLRFGWNLDKLEEEGKMAIIDFSTLAYLSREDFKKAMLRVQIPKFTIESVVDKVKLKVKEIAAKRLVADSITSLMIQEPDANERRREIAHLIRGLSETDCTCLVTSELRTTALERELQVEEYLAQGVILLHKIAREGQVLRIITIEKMRGTDHDTQPHLYTITKDGIKVFPKEKPL
jgi:KaiC/GvpD/RAD55 family RecA-like ATPase